MRRLVCIFVVSKPHKFSRVLSPISKWQRVHTQPRLCIGPVCQYNFTDQLWNSYKNFFPVELVMPNRNLTFFSALTHCRLVSSADNLCKQFGPRSGLTKCQAWSGSKLFDTVVALLKEFFEKVDFEKTADDKKSMQNYPSCKALRSSGVDKWSVIGF